MRSPAMRLFETERHPCGYFADRWARNLVLDRQCAQPAESYPLALACGFRRAGDHVYRPHCESCQACVPCRVPVARFAANRSQRRCRADNRDLVIHAMPPGCTEERLQLYRSYLRARHPDGGMDQADGEDFQSFLGSGWSDTVFLEMRRKGQLVGVAVTDLAGAAASAVYNFFDPQLAQRSLGTMAILAQIDLARHLERDHLYLGYWIADHPKMAYKARFRPLEILGRDGWQTVDVA